MEDTTPIDVTVHKLDQSGRSVTSYPGTVIERFASGVKLEARWLRPPLALGYVTFDTGDRFVEWFYTNRWYNIFEIHAVDGALKGWYCNIAAPARITQQEIACRDLLLDLWVHPDGATQSLDEDEFAREESLTEDERAHAIQALDELRAMVRQHAPPFERTSSP